MQTASSGNFKLKNIAFIPRPAKPPHLCCIDNPVIFTEKSKPIIYCNIYTMFDDDNLKIQYV